MLQYHGNIVIVFALLLGTAGACVAFALQIVTLKSEIESLQMASDSLEYLEGVVHQLNLNLSHNCNILYQQLNERLNTTIDMLHQQLNQQNQQPRQEYSALDNRTQQLNTSTQLLFDGWNEFKCSSSRHFQFYPAASCAALPPSSPSGYYWVRASNGSAVRVYCDMTTSCGDGGWMRVASLDFSNASTSCPSGLQERVDSGICTCGIESSGTACPSVMLSTSGVEYTKVCGKILAYQFSSPNGFDTHSGSDDIDGNYVVESA